MNKELIEKLKLEIENACYQYLKYKAEFGQDKEVIAEGIANEAAPLIASIAEQHFAPDWVSVEDRLPMVTTDDITKNIPDEYGNNIYKVVQVTDGKRIWYSGVGDHNVWYYEARESGVTHFRELPFDLPSPPKTDNNE